MAGKINSRCVGHGKLHRRMAGVFDLIALSVGYLGSLHRRYSHILF